jgi:hypothetical protein
MAINVFSRYIWLADTINRAGRISFEEINKKWQRTDMSEGKPLPIRTFHNHRIKIEEIFDINIDCDGYNMYYIDNKDNIEGNNLRSWLLNTFAVNNLLSESKALKNRILFEEIPSGEQFLTTIIEAMGDSVCLNIDYQPFWHDKVISLEIAPFCLKIFKQRWYLIGNNISINEIRHYSLDRINNLTATDRKFKIPKHFDAETYFVNAFGIVVNPKIKPCTIEIKAFGNRAKYLRTLPLHHSQKEIETADDYSVFQYFVAPSSDFRQEILSCGAEVEVVSPQNFRNEIADIIRKMEKRYNISKK